MEATRAVIIPSLYHMCSRALCLLDEHPLDALHGPATHRAALRTLLQQLLAARLARTHVHARQHHASLGCVHAHHAQCLLRLRLRQGCRQGHDAQHLDGLHVALVCRHMQRRTDSRRSLFRSCLSLPSSSSSSTSPSLSSQRSCCGWRLIDIGSGGRRPLRQRRSERRRRLRDCLLHTPPPPTHTHTHTHRNTQKQLSYAASTCEWVQWSVGFSTDGSTHRRYGVRTGVRAGLELSSRSSPLHPEPGQVDHPVMYM
jgi:hypothetical protein